MIIKLILILVVVIVVVYIVKKNDSGSDDNPPEITEIQPSNDTESFDEDSFGEPGK